MQLPSSTSVVFGAVLLCHNSLLTYYTVSVSEAVVSFHSIHTSVIGSPGSTCNRSTSTFQWNRDIGGWWDNEKVAKEDTKNGRGRGVGHLWWVVAPTGHVHLW